MPGRKETVMETAICSSISRAAGLGDAFWRANLRDVAVMAMPPDPSQSEKKPLNKGKSLMPGTQHLFFSLLFISYFFILCFLFLRFSFCKSLKREKKTPMHAWDRMTHRYMYLLLIKKKVLVVPPSLASSSTATSVFPVQVKSEHNVMELLALEFSSLPDREMVAEGSDSAAGQQQQQQLAAPGCKSSQVNAMQCHDFETIVSPCILP